MGATHRLAAAALAATLTVTGSFLAGAARAEPADPKLSVIENIVVIYLENRSFDTLYGLFPGAEGLESAQRTQAGTIQVDRDGTPFATLPPPLDGKKKPDARLAHVTANGPFRLDPAVGLTDRVASPIHAFFTHQRQINGGRNDRFVSEGTTGGLPMGYFDGSSMALWDVAKRYTLADHFFQSAFGGSFLNHMWLVCACTPVFPNAPDALREVAGTGKDAKGGEPTVTADGYAVNTIQGAWLHDTSLEQTLLSVQTLPTIGDRLTDKGVGWTYYAGDFDQAVAGMAARQSPDGFSFHHHPFTYFKRFVDSAEERSRHLKDLTDFETAILDGALPPVAFYKPTGKYNQHPGKASVADGDRHVADLIGLLEKSPQWKKMVVIVTSDENGGFWDHVVPPKGDRWGPGSRIPALIVSPFARKGVVDHTPYETVSILRLIEQRFGLDPLGERDAKATSLARALDLP